MKIIYQNLKHGIVKLQPENQDDLWYLSTIIDSGDLVKGYTLRKIKLGKEDARKAQVKKKKVFLEIKTEKIDFKADLLRLSGIVMQGPEDVPRGAHHTFNIEPKDVLSIIKEKWLKFQIDKLKEAATAKLPKILIIIHDREEALFALSKRKGYEFLSDIKGDVQKKAVEQKVKSTFYLDVIKKTQDYSKKYKIQHIILASPAFWKEDLMKQLKDDELKQKITLATCSSVNKTAINEVLKRPEIQEVLKKDRIAKEIALVEQLLGEISKNENASYGIKETKLAADAGAIKILLITDRLIKTAREKQQYSKLDSIMKTTDNMKGEIHIISSDHEAGKKLDGLGGIGAILRYKIN
ncbi:mRNA surveillance protein pelota [Candidatus Woesearchaeota archaeon]|nr:mRNA surveillance protein pelota [Candidatus Woesearchaeota archaeon]